MLRHRLGRVLYELGWLGLRYAPSRLGQKMRQVFLTHFLGDVGRNLSVSTGVKILAPEKVKIGADVWIGHRSMIVGFGEVEIGRDVMIAHETVVQTSGHEIDGPGLLREHPPVFAKVVIGDNVWVGARSMIRYGVTIGSGAVIGMGAVVVKDVPENAVVGGNPARVIRVRGSDDRRKKTLIAIEESEVL